MNDEMSVHGPKPTWQIKPQTPAFRGRADVEQGSGDFRF
jgi:hypothetical protein